MTQLERSGVLRWGGDQEGGGPYIYADPDDPSHVIGFETELMGLVARELGVRSEMSQGEWGLLPQLLERRQIDVVVNGYELTDAHLEHKIATHPYYVYELQLIVKRGGSVRGWDDLRGKRVGILNGSSADLFVQGLEGVESVGFDGVAQAFEKLEDGELDATVQDFPAWTFLSSGYPSLEAVGDLRGRGYYVMYLRPGDEALRDAIDQALARLVASGEMQALYERYSLWTPAQETLSDPALGREHTATHHSGFDVVSRNAPLLLEGAAMTVFLSCVSMPIAIVLGLFVALGRLYAPRVVSIALAAYVEFLRGTPLMLQLFMIFYVLPSFGLRMPPLAAAIIGLAVNYSAYEAEIYRAGLLAIPAGQMEAALALGMSRATALRHIVVPQAVRLVVPPVTNDFIALFKDTSVCSVVTVLELTKRYSIISNSNTGATLELAAVTAILYLLMSYPMSVLARRLERQVPRVHG